VSVQTIVSRGVAGRLHVRRDAASAVLDQRPAVMVHPPVAPSAASMRLLETGLALTAIATAILIGLGR
jgi:hypothetical protein